MLIESSEKIICDEISKLEEMVNEMGVEISSIDVNRTDGGLIVSFWLAIIQFVDKDNVVFIKKFVDKPFIYYHINNCDYIQRDNLYFKDILKMLKYIKRWP